MNDNQYEPVVREKFSFRNHITLIISLLVVVLIGLGFGGYYVYTQYLAPADLLDGLNYESYGLDITPSIEGMGGSVYFSASTVETDEEDSLPYSYRLDVTSGNATKIALKPQFAVTPLTADTRLVVASLTKNYTTDSWQPQIYNTETAVFTTLSNKTGHAVQDLVLSPDAKQYAYSYQLVPTPEEEAQIDDNWNIAIHTFDSDTVITIPAAHGPKWINGNTQILYIGTAGVYRYDIATAKAELVLGGERMYTKFDEVAVSPDSKTVVLTIPEINLLSVLHFDDPKTSQLVETGRVFAEATSYSNPVISPDGKSYAVLATLITDIKPDGDSYTFTSTNSIELRRIESAEVVKEYVVPEAPNGTIFISSWTAE